MQVLLLLTSFNSLSQRVAVELREWGHHVSHLQVAGLDRNAIAAAVYGADPDLIVAPYLESRIPASVWRHYRCLVVHAGVPGDRGPSPLDWAILSDERSWGVTILQANGEWDAGRVWAHEGFTLAPLSKSIVYRNQVTQAAITALRRILRGRGPAAPADLRMPGRARPRMRQRDRTVDWSGSTAEVQRRLRASDSDPGVLDTILGQRCYVFGGQAEAKLRGEPGDLLARRAGAICRATGDGAVWLTHLRPREQGSFKRSAVDLLRPRLNGLPELPLPLDGPRRADTYQDIWYEERGPVGYVRFEFYNGAMGTDACHRLRHALRLATRRRTTRVIVLMNHQDMWSNGIDLNAIEAAREPGAETWRNLQAINDLVRDVIETRTHLVVAAMQGNAAAGGVMLALAADGVVAHPRVVLNPHYDSMNLFGAEYWTYLLPRRVGSAVARDLTTDCRPMGVAEAARLGLLDDVLPAEGFEEHVDEMAQALAAEPGCSRALLEKELRRRRDERERPLAAYRAAEEQRMRSCITDEGYHRARRDFVRNRARRPVAEALR